VIPLFRPPRPTGVTILTVLQIIVGFIDILLGIILLALYAFSLTFLGMGFSTGFAFLLIPLALASFAFGFISFVLAYGLWNGRQWAWTSTMIISIIGLIVGIVGLIFGSLANVLPVIFYGLILAYLSTANVRAFFGRPVGPRLSAPRGAPIYPPQPPPPYPQAGYQPMVYPPTALAGPVPQTYYPQPPQPSFQQPGALGSCPSCGSPLAYYASFCDRCGTRVR
jgi:hypothetical protein